MEEILLTINSEAFEKLEMLTNRLCLDLNTFINNAIKEKISAIENYENLMQIQ